MLEVAAMVSSIVAGKGEGGGVGGEKRVANKSSFSSRLFFCSESGGGWDEAGNITQHDRRRDRHNWV